MLFLTTVYCFIIAHCFLGLSYQCILYLLHYSITVVYSWFYMPQIMIICIFTFVFVFGVLYFYIGWVYVYIYIYLNMFITITMIIILNCNDMFENHITVLLIIFHCIEQLLYFFIVLYCSVLYLHFVWYQVFWNLIKSLIWYDIIYIYTCC